MHAAGSGFSTLQDEDFEQVKRSDDGTQGGAQGQQGSEAESSAEDMELRIAHVREKGGCV